MNIRWVRQEEQYGCVIASLAMITGKTYQEVRQAFTGMEQGRGTDWTAMQAYLADLGYAVQWRFAYCGYTNQKYTDWPPKAWADVHICTVETALGGHSVIMLQDGSVLDPATPEVKRLTDYQRVMNLAAVYHVGLFP